MNDMFSHAPDLIAVTALLGKTPHKCRGCEALRGGRCGPFNRAAGSLKVRQAAINIIVDETPLPDRQPTCTDPK